MKLNGKHFLISTTVHDQVLGTRISINQSKISRGASIIQERRELTLIQPQNLLLFKAAARQNSFRTRISKAFWTQRLIAIMKYSKMYWILGQQDFKLEGVEWLEYSELIQPQNLLLLKAAARQNFDRTRTSKAFSIQRLIVIMKHNKLYCTLGQ